jgi:hypothetical protein
VSLVFILLQHLVLVGCRVGSIILQRECYSVALRASVYLVFIPLRHGVGGLPDR